MNESEDASDQFSVPWVMETAPKGSATMRGGEMVVIEGLRFEGATQVRFGPYLAEFRVVSDDRIEATAPAVDLDMPLLDHAFVRVFNEHGGSIRRDRRWSRTSSRSTAPRSAAASRS